MPFWVDRAIDREHGGVTNIITDDGGVTSTEKYLWSQGRALFTFASLYNDFDGDRAWLEMAGPVAAFLLRHGRDDAGRWHFALHRDGSVSRLPASVYVYVYVYAAYGLREYERATGDRAALDASLQTLRRLDPLLERHEELPTEPHAISPPFAAHGVWMMFAMVFDHVGRIAGDDALCARAVELAERVFAWHVHPELEDVLRALGAHRRDIMLKVGIPRALPYFFGSLKVAITLAFVGSVISETVAANVGIGHMLPIAQANFEVPLVFAGLWALAVEGIGMYAAFAWLERRLTGWAFRRDAANA